MSIQLTNRSLAVRLLITILIIVMNLFQGGGQVLVHAEYNSSTTTIWHESKETVHYDSFLDSFSAKHSSWERSLNSSISKKSKNSKKNHKPSQHSHSSKKAKSNKNTDKSISGTSCKSSKRNGAPSFTPTFSTSISPTIKPTSIASSPTSTGSIPTFEPNVSIVSSIPIEVKATTLPSFHSNDRFPSTIPTLSSRHSEQTSIPSQTLESLPSSANSNESDNLDLAEISLIAAGGGLFLFGVAYVLNRRRMNKNRSFSFESDVGHGGDFLSPVQEVVEDGV